MNLQKLYKTIGEYRHYENCRFCFSEKLVPVIQLGNMPLAGGFLRKLSESKTEKLYPLEIAFCANCYLLQSVNVIDADTLFKDYFYHSSAIKTLVNHFSELANDIKNELQKKKNSFVVEIGANDGTFVKALLKENVNAIGVDPARNIIEPLIKKGLPFINDYFTKSTAQRIKKKYGKADIIFSSNTLAHIEDMHTVIGGVKFLLKPDGYLMFEVHYIENLLQEMQYDFLYHEHQYYYSLITLKKFFALHDMEIFDVKPISIHAGSMRYFVKHKNDKTHAIAKNVTQVLKNEMNSQFDKVETYITYGEKIAKTKKDLLKLITKLKSQNKSIAGYGASGRGTIIMNYCGLTNAFLDYVIDDAPAKLNTYTPGNHLKIVSSNILYTKNKPDYVVIFAWSFMDEIKKRNEKYLKTDGKFIVPLPKVKIVS
jgi:methylation protein EvaC